MNENLILKGVSIKKTATNYYNRMKHHDFVFKDNVTILAGLNGAGKSSVLSAIEEIACNRFRNTYFHDKEKEKQIVLDINPNFTVHKYAGHTNNGKYQGYIDTGKDLRELFSSEGESISSSFMYWLAKIKKDVELNILDVLTLKTEKEKNGGEIPITCNLYFKQNEVMSKHNAVILIDEIDSGLTPDLVDFNIKTIEKVRTALPHIQFVIASNNYSFMKNFKEILWVEDGTYIDVPKTYEDYVSLYVNARERYNYDFLTRKK